MTKIPEFHFDYDKVEGMDITEAMQTLFGQMEAHYNKHIKPAPILFGGKTLSAPQIRMESTPPGPNPLPDMIDPDKIAPPAPAKPAGPVDTETITPKTINMKSFAIKDGKELGLKAGDSILKGITDKGAEVFDKLLPGYDQQPYGPVVAGESGRYNLNWKPAK
jgi:hypothetical protein